jgi:hypothetical protein
MLLFEIKIRPPNRLKIFGFENIRKNSLICGHFFTVLHVFLFLWMCLHYSSSWHGKRYAEGAGIEPRTAAPLALAARRSNRSTRSHLPRLDNPQTRLGLMHTRHIYISHPHSARSRPQTQLVFIHTRLDLIHRLNWISPHQARSHPHSARSHHGRSLRSKTGLTSCF